MIDAEETIQLFNDHCVIAGKMIRIYGQFHPKALTVRSIKKLRMASQDGHAGTSKISIYGKRNDFYLTLPYTADFVTKTYCLSMGARTIIADIKLRSPFQSFDGADESAIIVTMVKDYENRIVEWIHYHLALGFSKIIVFDNNSTDHTSRRIQDLNDGRVVAIPFSYTHFSGQCFADTQRIALATGVNAFRNFCRWICLTDADEFIYIPGMQPMDIEKFLGQKRFRRYRALTMQSILLTNKNNDDPIDNDILNLCRFSNLKPKYTKTIINTAKARRMAFVKNPHRLRGQLVLPMDAIYHGHCWCNERMEYHDDFTDRGEFLDFKNTIIKRKGL